MKLLARTRCGLAGFLIGSALAASAGPVPGAVAGHLSAHGKDVPGEEGGSGPYDSHKYRFLERVNYAEMTDFIVWLEGGPPPPAATNLSPLKVVVQSGGTFEPHVMPIRVGTEVDWPNNDTIYHNVFSYSDARPFDLGLYKKGDQAQHVVFDKPGRVDVFCSIHKNMHCILLVLETPWFATTDARGNFLIPNVPPGKYQLRTWCERLPPQVREVEVREAATARVDLVLGITGLPQL